MSRREPQSFEERVSIVREVNQCIRRRGNRRLAMPTEVQSQYLELRAKRLDLRLPPRQIKPDWMQEQHYRPLPLNLIVQP